MGTLGTIASGAMSNLIHRARSVALKEERRLVLMPRETPLSTIHLENMLTLAGRRDRSSSWRRASTTARETVDDLVDFVVGRALDLLGSTTRWSGDGATVSSTGTLPANEVRRCSTGSRRSTT
jgi:4-hydroxy-3-polyprenylbenzoate decarboxylase